jgi:hypothetical protein
MVLRTNALLRLARPVVIGGVLLFVCSVARGQGSCTFTDENGKTVILPNCKDPNEKPAAAKTPTAEKPAGGAAKSFPFPGETSATPVGSGTQRGDKGTPDVAKRFPFPGDDGAGSDAKPAPGLQDAGSSGTSSDPDAGGSSSSSSSSANSDSSSGEGPLAGDDDPAAAAAAARKARRRLPKVDAQTPDAREKEDLDVAAFYQENANYKGAYVRAVDAVSIAADDPDAHFALAEAARRLGKLDEAEAHYKKCLTLDPVPKVKKAAEKALKEMAGG